MAIQNVLPIINSLLRKPAVKSLLGISSSTIDRNIKKGLFVKSIAIGGSKVAWSANEVDALIRARIAGKTDSEIRLLVSRLELARNEII